MSEEFKPPSYEDYVKATEFARIRYKYGLVVTGLACVLLVLLIAYVIYYAEELKTHPMQYTAKAFDMSCSCVTTDGKLRYDYNKTGISYEEHLIPIYQPN
jgi:hypothetical protein|tara:strand:+ start:503 stop:802 length:300 start_codon:yes stop_codon:yes gene_type:complete